jgi:hypothetical protein
MENISINSADYPFLIDERYEKPSFEISIHKLVSKNIVIIYPGANGSKDGYQNKYLRMAEKLVSANVGAVIRTPNTYMIGNWWTTCLEIVINYAINNSTYICGTEKPDLYLVGHSVGAGAIDLVSNAYDEIKKLLMTSPAPLRRNNIVQHGIEEFEGELSVFIPENDRAIPREDAMQFYNLAVNAEKRNLEIVNDCDHEWSGEKNLEYFINLPTKIFS